MRPPDFIGIGVQKAGTTWLDKLLRQHPLVFLPPIKEIHYFDCVYMPTRKQKVTELRRTNGERALLRYLEKYEPNNRNKEYLSQLRDIIDGEVSDNWYLRVFTLARASQICGEITPAYSILPEEGIRHVLRVAPNAKFLLSIRDPIDRCWSQIRMFSHRSGRNTLQDLQRIAGYLDIYPRSDYPSILERWTRVVGEGKLLVLIFDDIVDFPLNISRSICDFLQIPCDPDYFEDIYEVVNSGDGAEIPKIIYNDLKIKLEPIYRTLLKSHPAIGNRWISRHYSI